MTKIQSPRTQDNAMWDIWMSTFHLAIVSVADELGIFNCINSQKVDLDSIANKLDINYRSAQILLEPLVGLGFLYKNSNKFSLTHSAKTYLLPKSLFYWGSVLDNLRNRSEHKKIIDAIRQGRDQLSIGKNTYTEMWKQGKITTEAAEKFTKDMHSTIFAPAIAAVKTGIFKSTKKLLDVGAGSGCFSIAYINEYPKNQAAVFDLPPVCEIAQKYIIQFKAEEKIKVHSGNFFNQKEWPKGYDGILFSQILHDWSFDVCNTLLKKSYEILPCGGKIYIHEMLLNNERTSPLTISCFDLLMFINHKSQQFSKNELFCFLTSIGFKKIKLKKTFGYYSIVTATK